MEGDVVFASIEMEISNGGRERMKTVIWRETKKVRERKTERQTETERKRGREKGREKQLNSKK